MRHRLCGGQSRGTESLAEIHHRQPGLLDKQHLDLWLNGEQSSEGLPTLEVPFHPVAMRVGNTRYDAVT